MGIAITQEQRELADAVRGWIARVVPPDEVRKLLDAPAAPGHRPPFWDGLAGQGLLGVHLPESCGGGGGTLLDLAVAVEEAGRAALPGPYLGSALTAEVLRRAGRDDLAGALAGGERIGAVAFGPGGLGVALPGLGGLGVDVSGSGGPGVAVPGSEGHSVAVPGPEGHGADVSGPEGHGADVSGPEGPSDDVSGSGGLGAAVPGPGGLGAAASGSEGPSAAVPGSERLGAAVPGAGGLGADVLGSGGLGAVVGPGGFVLDGVAPPVLTGADADLLVLAAESADGVVWLAVDADTPGLTVRGHESADPTRPTAEVVAAGAVVPAGRVLAVDGTLVRDLAAVLLAADACGTAAWALDTAAEHAKVREQFGRPIGRFQGVKHLCADMLVRVEQACALVWDAARALDDEPAEDVRGLAAALAAGSALDTAYSCAKDCIQILGGTGFTWEHDAHLYLRRAVVARQLLGAGDAHRLRAVRLAGAGARRELRCALPAEANGYREEARAVIAGVRGLDPAAARRALAPTGYAAPHLPPPYGLGAGPVQQLAVQEELSAAGVKVADLGIATWVVPSLLAYGTPAQRDRYLPPTLRGDLLWCQLFSEPGAGSDLASLRTRAERTGDGRWRINGQKVWTSAAQWADHGILLARTNPQAPKHRGLTYFLVDMKNTDGIDIRPLREITGDSLFNEVYFDDVLLPADAVVGEVDDGWRVARHTLGNERVHMADQLTFDTGLEALLARSGGLDGAYRARIGALAAEAHALGCIGLRTTMRQIAGEEPGAGASVRKLVQTPHQQKVAELALELLGPTGALREGPGERALHGFLLSRCLTIAGGTTQVQLNVVAERILGLPRD
ncbi:acyl-CoA dehydrogenase family protein [Streptomyces kunmingensis]|uniref:Acyl-CoA dehydrogenase family protein n=1 Tax=Streptomyces kunmingensis TaxID=68225 RepID=A0ABU6C4R0_9ACTN|nr:acyl-CoA dehydrogenase family protein [Streptomyces kunmingensis]MEB3959714.1 acyl-CoA dehydrogenase family protein [Streptomyces kunmingensis]